MFASACKMAAHFTQPVVLARRRVDGKCGSGIASFVPLNEEGWILTAAHVLKQFADANHEAAEVASHPRRADAIRNDPSLPDKAKRERLRQLGKPRADQTEQSSAWWGRDGVMLVEAHVVEPVDLGVARLAPFPKDWIKTYPVLKDPKKNFDNGTSLCKLGFPFHSITPDWDQTTSTFQLPAEAMPLPFFPIEGIFTRTAEIRVQVPPGAPPPPPPPFPLRWLETSSPGLRGQSGGPIFDTEGRVWAIQSRTNHLDLGFTLQNQYLNVGLGVHMDTILGFLNQLGVKYELSRD